MTESQRVSLPNPVDGARLAELRFPESAMRKLGQVGLGGEAEPREANMAVSPDPEPTRRRAGYWRHLAAELPLSKSAPKEQ